MGKKIGSNWMLLITVFLFLLSVGVVVYKLIESSQSTTCTSEGQTVQRGESIYQGDNKCVCTSEGILICDDGLETTAVQESPFVTDNLKFSYTFLNSLVSERPIFSNVKTVDVSQTEGKLKVVIEREVWCSEEMEAPNQVAFYQLNENILNLSTLTAFDEKINTKNCLVSNSFEFSNLDFQLNENFKISYSSEDGKKTTLNTCVFQNVIYGGDDTFSGLQPGEICTCDNGLVKCK